MTDYNLKNELRSYQNEFDRLQGAKRTVGLQPNVKQRMKELQHKARQSLNNDTHRSYYTKTSFIIIYRNMEIFQKRKDF